jgi:hypothetical protein
MKLGRRNAQSDEAAAEALAFAERMRPILAEMGALSANRAAAALNERRITTAAGARGLPCRSSGCGGASKDIENGNKSGCPFWAT